MGNIGGVFPTYFGGEGVQLVHNENKWYAIIAGGNPDNTSDSRIIKIDFGTNLNNDSPTATDWGNIGNLYFPVDLNIFHENSGWYGLTVNSYNKTITRFNFSNSFENVPTADNLGDAGGLLSFPTGIYAVNNNANWYVFITNRNNQSLVRLNFGNSITNTPTALNLGNPNNTLNSPRDISIMQFCGEAVAFVTNENTNDLIKLNFSSDFTNAPVATSLGNIGNFNFPHSLSKIFRVGSDLYSLIPNVNNNTITRLRFAGCNNSGIPNSIAQNPPDIIYDSPGVYNVHLLADEGLPTQTEVTYFTILLYKKYEL